MVHPIGKTHDAGALEGAVDAAVALRPEIHHVDVVCGCLLIGFVTSTLYFMVFEWLYGATPGKVILGIRVVMEDGRPCSLGAALIRDLLRLIDGLFFGIPAYVTMKEPLLQRIGDKAAKTVVVGAKDTFIRQAPEWWWFIVAAAIYLGIEIIASLIQMFTALR